MAFYPIFAADGARILLSSASFLFVATFFLCLKNKKVPKFVVYLKESSENNSYKSKESNYN